MRVVDFMNAAPGVTTIDSTGLNLEQTVQAVVDAISAKTSAG
jgi:cytidylate kinase